MKKLIIVLVIIAFAFAYSNALAVDYPEGNNVIVGSRGGVPTDPPRDIRLVRYGVADANASGLLSGDCVIWDTNSSDGLSVILTTTAGDERFAGICAMPIGTDDNGAVEDVPTTRNWGYIAVRGYALASIDAAITAGTVLSGLGVSTVSGALGSNSDLVSSQDIAVLLETSTAGTLRPVMIK